MMGSTCVAVAPRPSSQRRHEPLGRARLSTGLPTQQHLRRTLEHTIVPAFRVTREALWSPTRGRPAEAFARQVGMYLAHVGLGLSINAVARLFARDRRTVAHACALVEDRRDGAAFDRALDLLEGALPLISARQA